MRHSQLLEVLLGCLLRTLRRGTGADGRLAGDSPVLAGGLAGWTRRLCGSCGLAKRSCSWPAQQACPA